MTWLQRRFAGLILLVGASGAALAVLSLSSTGEAKSRYANCGPADAKTIIANDRIRVYKVTTPRDDAEDDVVACLADTKVRRTIESPGDTYYTFRPPALQLRGPMIGLATDFCDQETGCETFVTVLDLSKTFTDEPVAINGSVGEPKRLVKVGSLRFRPNGSLAWIACSENDTQVFSASRQPNCVRPGRGRKWVMRKHVGSSDAEVLDTGRQIDPSSLRLNGSRLTWKKDGRRRVRQLP